MTPGEALIRQFDNQQTYKLPLFRETQNTLFHVEQAKGGQMSTL